MNDKRAIKSIFTIIEEITPINSPAEEIYSMSIHFCGSQWKMFLSVVNKIIYVRASAFSICPIGWDRNTLIPNNAFYLFNISIEFHFRRKLLLCSDSSQKFLISKQLETLFWEIQSIFDSRQFLLKLNVFGV